MPVQHTIGPDKLARLVGLPGSPAIVDLRSNPSAAIPGSIFRSVETSGWARLGHGAVVTVDAEDGGEATAVAALLRSDGVAAEALEGGFAAWLAAELPTVSLTYLPPRHVDGGTWWVTRARPKVDRIACPWLIRRFIDPEARFLFVNAGEVLSVAADLEAEPFDISDDRVRWSHCGDRCTFDTMLDAFGLAGHEPLARLAAIVRGADTDRLDAAPEAAGLLAISLGLSRIHADDHVQLDAGMAVYDALYRWSRDARSEKHNWSSHQPTRGKVS